MQSGKFEQQVGLLAVPCGVGKEFHDKVAADNVLLFIIQGMIISAFSSSVSGTLGFNPSFS
jgi:hypothetical protein